MWGRGLDAGGEQKKVLRSQPNKPTLVTSGYQRLLARLLAVASAVTVAQLGKPFIPHV